jgi:hypothetical protein
MQYILSQNLFAELATQERFQVLTVVKMLTLVSCVLTQCGIVGRHGHFEETYC